MSCRSTSKGRVSCPSDAYCRFGKCKRRVCSGGSDYIDLQHPWAAESVSRLRRDLAATMVLPQPWLAVPTHAAQQAESGNRSPCRQLTRLTRSETAQASHRRSSPRWHQVTISAFDAAIDGSRRSRVLLPSRRRLHPIRHHAHDAFELGVLDDQRQLNAQHVTVVAADADEDAALEAVPAHGARRGRGGLVGAPVRHQLDADHQAPAAHLADQRLRGDEVLGLLPGSASTRSLWSRRWSR